MIQLSASQQISAELAHRYRENILLSQKVSYLVRDRHMVDRHPGNQRHLIEARILKYPDVIQGKDVGPHVRMLPRPVREVSVYDVIRVRVEAAREVLDAFPRAHRCFESVVSCD